MISNADFFWLAFVAAFISGMGIGWCLRDVRDMWGHGHGKP